MTKALKSSCVLVLLTWVMIAGIAAAAGYKTTELNRKIAEITELQSTLSGKIALAKEKKDQLEEKTKSLKEEIVQEKDHLGIQSYNEAVLAPRIDYNLKLIQLLLGYMTSLDEKIRYLQNGHETLGYYFQQAQDDLLMIKTLNDLEVEKLIALINAILDEYTPATSKPLFDVDRVSLKDTEQIWQDIVN